MALRPETRSRFLRHAGIPEADESGGPTISGTTYEAIDPGKSKAAIADFVDALEALNHELNGVVPSEVRAADDNDVPRDVAYAVAEASRMLREAGCEHGAWRVETAWLAVIAGDIDDVVEHVDEEARGRLR